MKALFLTDEELNQVTGGKVNPNFTPDGNSFGKTIDNTINGGNYDRIADAIVGWLNKDNPNSSYNTRSRAVNNDVDIYDFD